MLCSASFAWSSVHAFLGVYHVLAAGQKQDRNCCNQEQDWAQVRSLSPQEDCERLFHKGALPGREPNHSFRPISCANFGSF